MSNLKNVANAAGVSIMTVSRVVNNVGNVKDETRILVEKVIEDLEYYPNNLGRSLNQNRVNIIGVMAPIEYEESIGNDPYYASLLFGIEMLLVDKSYDLLLSTQRKRKSNGEKVFDYFRPYLEHKADGLVLMGAILSENNIKTIIKKQIPICIIGDRPDIPITDIVDSDNYNGIQTMLEKAYQLGHRKIAFGGWNKNNYNINDRYNGYCDFLKAKALPFKEEWVFPVNDVDSVESQIFQQYLTLEDKPTVIICSTDHFAIDLIRKAEQMNIDVPNDLSVTGFDGILIGQNMNPKLTTMVQPLKEMGRIAAEFVLNRINDLDKEREIAILPVVMEEGASLSIPSSLSVETVGN